MMSDQNDQSTVIWNLSLARAKFTVFKDRETKVPFFTCPLANILKTGAPVHLVGAHKTYIMYMLVATIWSHHLQYRIYILQDILKTVAPVHSQWDFFDGVVEPVSFC